MKQVKDLKSYTFNVRYTYEGKVTVKATCQEQAKELIKLTLKLPDAEVINATDSTTRGGGKQVHAICD